LAEVKLKEKEMKSRMRLRKYLKRREE